MPRQTHGRGPRAGDLDASGREGAEPVPATEGGDVAQWRGISVTARHILDALDGLARRSVSDAAGRHEGWDEGGPRITQVLASSLTLVVFVADEASLREAEAAIRAFPQRRPARVILVLPDPQASPEGVDAWVRAETGAREGSTQIRHEQVTLRVRRMASRHLANLVRSLVVPQLPVYGWTFGTFPFGRSWQADWEDILDRLLIDTGPAHHPLDEIAAFGELLERRPPFSVGDLGYARLRPWQEALAEIFDAPTRRGLLARLDRVEIRGPVVPYAPEEPSSGALLLTGWLASRLNWGPARAGMGSVMFERPGGDVRVVYCAEPTGDAARPFRSSGIFEVRLETSVDRAGRAAGARAVGVVLTADAAGYLRWSTLDGSSGGRIPLAALDTAHALYASVERIGDRILRPTVQRAAQVARSLLRGAGAGAEEGEFEAIDDSEGEREGAPR